VGDLDGLANRGYTPGFYDRHPDREYQNYLSGSSESKRSLYVGDVLGYAADGMAEIGVKNRFSVGDRIELIHPAGNSEHVLTKIVGADDTAIGTAPGSGHRVRIPLPAGREGAFVARFVDQAAKKPA
jgi:putative protease